MEPGMITTNRRISVCYNENFIMLRFIHFCFEKFSMINYSKFGKINRLHESYNNLHYGFPNSFLAGFRVHTAREIGIVVVFFIKRLL